MHLASDVSCWNQTERIPRTRHWTPRRGADGAAVFGRQKSPIISCVHVFAALELFHFIPTLKLPPFQSQTGSGGTPDRDIRAPRGDSSSGFLGFFFFFFCSGKRFVSIQTAGAARLFPFFCFLNGPSEKGAGQHSAPPRLCLSQLLGRSTFPQSH